MIAEIEKTQTQGDTLGGEFEVYASGVPLGLGSYVQWDRRLEAEIGKSFLSLNAIKGVEIGLGFQSARLPGSLVHDELYPSHSSGHFNSKIRFKTNRSGGIDGGMSTTQPLIVRAAMKPLSTLMKPLQSVHLATGEALSAHVERSDACAVPAAGVIGESLLALVLAEAVLDKFGGDSILEVSERIESWKRKSPIE
jgi:chorismate synthase